MRRRLLLGLVPTLVPVVLGFGACAADPVNLGLTMLAPQGLLDEATSIELFVFEAEQAKCLATGHVDAIPAEGTQKFTLGKDGCAAGASYCKTIELDKDGVERMFAVVAKSAAGVLAEGCTTARVDQDPLEVSVKLQRYNPPGCCNDGALQTGEQCDTGKAAATTCGGAPGGECKGVEADAVCECDCKAREILLSSEDGDTQPKLGNGAPGTKSRLAMAFGPGGASYPNALRAVFVNTDERAKGGADIHERFLAQDLYSIDDPFLLSLQLRLPLACGTVQGGGILRKQDSPAIATASKDTIAVVYRSDEVVADSFDLFLSPQTAEGCVDTHACSKGTECQTGLCVGGTCAYAVQINPAGSSGVESPDVAGGPAGSALVVWSRGGGVYGRIWSTNGALLPADGEITIAPNASNARVAGNADGWKVVYQGGGSGDGDGIFLRSVDPTGAVGGEVRVNAATEGVQDQPDVAALEDGQAMVVWRSGGDVFFQRFDASGAPAAKDQDEPLNTQRDGQQQNPAVAASVGFGQFFAVAWETVESADIAARFVRAPSAGGESVFGFNSVTGQNDEFPATHPAIPQGRRSLPAVAIGGAGFVAIGWQDDSAEHPGVYVRRFPLPQ